MRGSLEPQAPTFGSLRERAIETAWTFFFLGTVGFMVSLGVGGVASDMVPSADYVVVLTLTEIFVFTCLGFLVAGVGILSWLGSGLRTPLADGGRGAVQDELGGVPEDERRLADKSEAQDARVKRLEAELAAAQSERKETMDRLEEKRSRRKGAQEVSAMAEPAPADDEK